MTTQSDRRIHAHVAALGSTDKRIAERTETLLIRHYGSRPIDALIAASESPDEQTRFRAAWILGKTRDARAFDALVRLTDDSSGAVRYDAALALGHLGDPRAIDTLIRILCVPDPVHSVDSAAIEALAMLGKPIIPALDTLAKSDDPEVLVQAFTPTDE